ncbi:hypothetical protein [Actinopolyspora mortivallis]|uniref:hypothetical protein n=1 Tax=Actinopolyspora mortivallis TaxID=33906 RepID=UPI002158F8D4|nr:hypothetical protein [Actinopolyspora mortivallis]
MNGPHGPLLEPTSLRARSGELLLVTGPPRSGRTALALVLSGRLRPDRGTVLRNGRRNPARLRETVSVIDAPGITEPEGALELTEIVGEGLSLAGRRCGRKAVRRWITGRGLDEWAHTRFEQLPPRIRTRVLLDLGRAPRGTEALVLDCPDRHGDDPLNWYPAAREAAEHGYAVVVVCSPHSADDLNAPTVRIGTSSTIDDPPSRTDALRTPDQETPGTTS